MESGSYIRARNVQLSYTLPAYTSKTIGMEKLKVYVQTTNLFTITKYKGLDPGVVELIPTLVWTMVTIR